MSINKKGSNNLDFEYMAVVYYCSQIGPFNNLRPNKKSAHGAKQTYTETDIDTQLHTCPRTPYYQKVTNKQKNVYLQCRLLCFI